MPEPESAPGKVNQEEFWNQGGGERWAANLDNLEAMLEPLGRAVLERAMLRPGEDVLDVGCGAGVTTAWIAEQVGPGGTALGVDVSAVILEKAQAATGNARLLQADAGSHDFGESVFDVVFSRFGVMFFEDPVAAFRNLGRSLRPDGRLVFQCWTDAKSNPWFLVRGAAAEIIAPDEPPPDPEAPGPFYFSDEARVRDVLGQAGFKNVALERCEIEACAGQGGDLASAAEFALDMTGPLKSLLDAAGDELNAEVRAAVSALLEPYRRSEGVFVPTVTWIVSAASN